MARARGRHVAVIINTGSGSVGEDHVAQVHSLFSARGIAPQVFLCAGGADIRRSAERALLDGYDTVVAGGGDGTVNAVASVVAGTATALGILPLGTLNHFAKDAGIPLDMKEAVAAVSEGFTVSLDAGEVNGRIFVNNSSLGLYPMIVKHREAFQRLGRSKWWAFLRGLLTVVGWYPLLHVSLSSHGRRITRRTPFVFIGNNEYEVHGFKIGTRSRIDGGELCVYLAHHIGRAGLLILALRAVAGRLRDAVDIDLLRTTEVEVDVRGTTIRVALDGEVVSLAPPLRYRCRMKKLRVIVPKKEHTVNGDNGSRDSGVAG